MRGYRDLMVWQRSMGLAEGVYRLTKNFPGEERFGLTSQTRRAAVSVPALCVCHCLPQVRELSFSRTTVKARLFKPAARQ